MARSRQYHFTTIKTEGAILPIDLLGRIMEKDSAVPGLRPEDYHLARNEKINELINRAWNRMTAAWKSFKDSMEKLPESDMGTTVTREKWLLILFKELDYGRLLTSKAIEIEGKSYPITHMWQHTPLHLVSFKIDLDRRTKGVAGAASSSPHSLVQEFLNRSEEHLWAFVSNGLRLRILRDNVSLTRQAYLEFDLEAMMEGEVYSDFVLLWLLCHQSRVEADNAYDCWLEKWSKFAHDKGIRALDGLRNSVEQAISALGEGFISFPGNGGLKGSLKTGELSTQDYYRQLLRLVYRMIFLFAAEDRQALLKPDAEETAKKRYLNYYSTLRIRKLASRFKGTRHYDLFRGIKVVMQKLSSDEGCLELALPALGSFLWKDEAIPDLVACDISNRHLLKAVRNLAYITEEKVRRGVDYKNLGAEELGSVYESLLELHPVINVDAGTFRLDTAGGHERKTSGSYYTPTSLINCLLDSALDPVLEEATKKKDPESALLNLKICDPACGSGHFLVAASHRLAKALASVRTGDSEPSPEDINHALRDVIGRCIYGVDINPMAVELCKVSLWMEAMEPGKPLSFLDHHVKCGNSLIGTPPALLEKGIPDEAFKPILGDDKEFCTAYKKQNKKEREGYGGGYDGQMELFGRDRDFMPWERLGNFASAMTRINTINDSDIDGVHRKEEQYERLVKSSGYIYGKLLADAWCAAFMWKKKKTDELPYPITEEIFRRIEKNPHNCAAWIKEEISRLSKQYQFFHWHLEYSDVFRVPSKDEEPENEHMGWRGGFDCVLGNPPWERIKLQEKEWFADKDPDVAGARNASERKKKIKALEKEDPNLYRAFLEDKRKAEGDSHLVRNSGKYPLCGRGDINSYALFVELDIFLQSERGRTGCIVPSGIGTDDSYKYFFENIIHTNSLVRFLDFKNSNKIFSDVDSNMRFCLLTLSNQFIKTSEFAFFLSCVSQLQEKNKLITMGKDDILLFNPNTENCPSFRNKREMQISKNIFNKIPVLIDERQRSNSWGITFLRMFDLTKDSYLFSSDNNEDFVSLYEAKMFFLYNHRYADSAIAKGDMKIRGSSKKLSEDHLMNPNRILNSRYYVKKEEVYERLKSSYRSLLLKADSIKNWSDLLKSLKSNRDCLKEYFWQLLSDKCRKFIVNPELQNPLKEELKKLVINEFNILLQNKEFYQPSLFNDKNINKSISLLLKKGLGNFDSKDVIILNRMLFEIIFGKNIDEIFKFHWFLAFRDITGVVSNERTSIFSIIPRVAVGNSAPIIILDSPTPKVCCLYGNLCSFIFDFIARQKIGGLHLNYFILKQIPVLPFHNYSVKQFEFIVSRILELTYNSWDLEHFARECGYYGPPFKWNEERRFLIRCELDAAFFHLYEIDRKDLNYIMETFPIVRRKDEAKYEGFYKKIPFAKECCENFVNPETGEEGTKYATKAVILEIYDRMQRATESGTPYQTVLTPPPADPSCAHPPRE